MRKISDERVGRQSHLENEVNGLSAAQRAALAVAEAYPVFPCDPVTKRPLTKHGFKEASQERSQVLRWWKGTPEALIGVPTGSRSGLLAIDVDPDGRDWYREHQGRLGVHRLHGTRRGKHLLYRMNGEAIRNSAGEVADGVDVRGEGGYVIWWPAHGGVSVGTLGELPAWLERKCVSTTKSESNNPARSLHKLESVSHGARDDFLSKRAYALIKAGWGPDKTLAELKALNAYYCKPPMTDAELQRIIKGKRKLTEDNQTEGEVVLISAADTEETSVDWLWKGFLARNKLHLLSGAGGSMKSTLTLSWAATVSRGGRWPDETRAPRGNVIIWTGEDDLSDTVKPRLRFAGADLRRCYFVEGVEEKGKERSFDPSTDIAKLAKACDELGEVSLIIIDPAISVVQRDSNSAAEVRRGLDPLIMLGRKYRAAVLGIHHLNKGSKGRTPGDRVTGSGAWTQAPRLSLMVAAIDMGDGKVPDSWVLTCDKTWGKGKGGGYEYGFEEEPETEITRIKWGRRLEGSAHSILMEAEGGEDGSSKIGEAVRFLRKLLADRSMSVWEVRKQSEDAQIKWITLKRAKKELGIETLRSGKNSFRWSLPDEG